MRQITIVALLAVAVAASGCKKKVPPEDPLGGYGSSGTSGAHGPGSTADATSKLKYSFSRVHFGFDSTDLDEPTKRALREAGKVLQEHPEVRVEVQGHADERGTTEYNLGLGDRRAASVQKFLTAIGVSSAQLKTVSYGEERPLASGHSETVWSQNRRAEFRIISGESWLSGTVN